MLEFLQQNKDNTKTAQVCRTEHYDGQVRTYYDWEIVQSDSIRQLWTSLATLTINTPVFPRSWSAHFGEIFVPRSLYKSELSSEKALIHALHDQGDAKAAYHLLQFVKLNDYILSLSPSQRLSCASRHIVIALRSFFAWAMRDGGLKSTVFIDKPQREFITAVAAFRRIDHRYTKGGAHTRDRVVRGQVRRLVRRAVHLRDQLHLESGTQWVSFKGAGVPPVFSWLVVGPVVKVLVADPIWPQPNELIEIAFGTEGHSLWNAIRVGIIMCKARDEMMKLKSLTRMKESEEDDEDL